MFSKLYTNIVSNSESLQYQFINISIIQKKNTNGSWENETS